jgi:uncharacterized protein YacL
MMFFKKEIQYVLDSSSIIDGRVIHLFERRFFEGKILIPTLVRFIVKKIMGQKGERAINILKRNTRVEFVREKVDGMVEEVCVLKCGRRRHAKVFTVSDEVCRQSKYYPQVQIIDIRDLYRVLTPIFVPNKVISVKLLKRGHNHNEGVGYIEGVKIVVENGARFINQTISARVKTMLSLETGNLVFCTAEEEKSDEKSKQKNTARNKRSV